MNRVEQKGIEKEMLNSTQTPLLKKEERKN